MSKLQKYPKYKDSGIEWIGEIPEHWRTVKIKHLLYEKKKAYNTKLRCGSISFGKVVYKDDKKIPIETKKAYQVVERGNFLVNPLNLNYDLKSLRIALSELDVVVSSGYIVLDTSRDIEKRYLNYLLHRFDVAFMKTLGAGVRQTLNYNDISVCQLVEPPKNEQIQIAEYLDKKTEKIDKLISIKEKLIKRLKEQRQIIINNAVTKGLNPNVKMKDSGIEWIGEIPEHWEVKKLKYILNIYNGQDYKHVLSSDGYPVIGSGGEFAKASDYLYDGEAILFGRKGTIDKPLYVDCKFWTVDTMFYSVVKNNFSTRFLYYASLSIPFNYYTTSTALPSMTQHDLNNHKIPIPKKEEEQIQIAKYLDKKTAQIDKTIKLQEEQIEKLKEYKTTLIDSVVTGKVRVIQCI